MKRIIIILCLLWSTAQAQTIGWFRYDSVKFSKNPGTTELILENSTKGVTGGVLTNLGNGRTSFQPAGSTNVEGNLLYVDDVYGNDGTAAANKPFLPYLSLSAARTAATSGTTIIVRPGTYSFSGTTLLKNNVNWYFDPGTIITATALSSEAMFTDLGVAVSSKVTGYGEFSDILGGVSKILEITAASTIYFECQSMTVGDGDIDQTISIDAGTVTVYVRGTIESLNYDPIVVTGGTLNLVADKLLSSGATEGNGFEISGGIANIRCREIRSQGAYDASAATSAIAISGGTAIIEADIISELSDGVTLLGTGVATITIRGRVTSTARTAVTYLAGTTNKELILQSTLVSNTSFDSIDAPSAQTVSCYGIFANRAYDANISINGVITIGSYVK